MPESIDRYDPNPLDGPARFADKLRAMDRRISELEGAPLSGSQMRTTDTSGVTRMLTGDLGDGHYGFATYDANGTELTRTDERGIISPPLSVAMRGRVGAVSATPDGLTSTNASFETLFGGEVPSFVHQGLRLRISWATPATTTGELRVVIEDLATAVVLATSNVLTLPANTGAAATLSWLHGVPLPGPRCWVNVQTRRTSGAGVVTIVRPSGCYFVGPDGMTGSGGAWT